MNLTYKCVLDDMKWQAEISQDTTRNNTRCQSATKVTGFYNYSCLQEQLYREWFNERVVGWLRVHHASNCTSPIRCVRYVYYSLLRVTADNFYCSLYITAALTMTTAVSKYTKQTKTAMQWQVKAKVTGSWMELLNTLLECFMRSTIHVFIHGIQLILYDMHSRRTNRNPRINDC